MSDENCVRYFLLIILGFAWISFKIISCLFPFADNIGWWGTWEVTAGSLVLTAVPEPGTWLMLVFGLAFGLLVRRRR